MLEVVAVTVPWQQISDIESKQALHGLQLTFPVPPAVVLRCHQADAFTSPAEHSSKSSRSGHCPRADGLALLIKTDRLTLHSEGCSDLSLQLAILGVRHGFCEEWLLNQMLTRLFMSCFLISHH